MDDMITPVAITEATREPMLPATAGNMPLFALFGALALVGAGLIRVRRS
jgi:LPXTG-motif cell wall-anchored protein